MRSLDAYLRATGSSALDSYVDNEGEWQRLDDRVWEDIRRKLLSRPRVTVELADASSGDERYRFKYIGWDRSAPSKGLEPEAACVLCYWLPSELLEQRGPQWVREQVMEIAAPLPFSSGNAGLAFNCAMELVPVAREVRKYCFRYPGMDVLHPGSASRGIGARVRGPSWLTFLGQPVLGELGGAEGLRSRLHSPGTTVQQMEGDRAVVTLGPWPEAGDTEQGKELPAWRELARVLEPWTFSDSTAIGIDDPDDPRWARRFLD
ncbi:type VI immunity family protein [Pyxidicoccus sp. 3LG]